VVQQNLDLKPETIKTYELVWERRLNRQLFAVASLYHYKMHDLIDQVEDSLTGQSVFENVSRAITTGASGELSLDLSGDRDLSLSYSYQYAKDPDRKVHLTNSPEHLIQVRASTPLVERFRLSATGRWESSRTTVDDTRTNPFFLASANLLFRPAGTRPSNSTSFWRRTQMALMVDNLFNNGYELPAGTEQMQAALPQYGRRITLKLSVEW
jgi:iron complex outermembrane receptor protein